MLQIDRFTQRYVLKLPQSTPSPSNTYMQAFNSSPHPQMHTHAYKTSPLLRHKCTFTYSQHSTIKTEQISTNIHVSIICLHDFTSIIEIWTHPPSSPYKYAFILIAFHMQVHTSLKHSTQHNIYTRCIHTSYYHKCMYSHNNPHMHATFIAVISLSPWDDTRG